MSNLFNSLTSNQRGNSIKRQLLQDDLNAFLKSDAKVLFVTTDSISKDFKNAIIQEIKEDKSVKMLELAREKITKQALKIAINNEKTFNLLQFKTVEKLVSDNNANYFSTIAIAKV